MMRRVSIRVLFMIIDITADLFPFLLILGDARLSAKRVFLSR